MTTRQQIVDEARSWIDTRWQHQASLKGIACDCIGLVRGVARECGLVDPFSTGDAVKFFGYGRTPDPVALIEACDRYMDPRPLYPLELADILVMRFEKEPQHFAIISCLSPLRMIHSYAQARKVTENGIDGAWRGRILRVYSLRGVE